MTISIEEAKAAAATLKAAADSDTLPRQIRWELDGRADEYRKAAAMAEDVVASGEECAIEICSSVTRGMMVAHDRFGWCRVLRKLNDGLSLHMESPDGPNGWYRNFLDPTSPVVVRA